MTGWAEAPRSQAVLELELPGVERRAALGGRADPPRAVDDLVGPADEAVRAWTAGRTASGRQHVAA